jgi:hypothetical protein
MSHEVRDPNGKLLFTSAELQRALNPSKMRERRSSRWPEWMRQLRWPTGMVEAFRAAYRARSNAQMALIIKEANALYEAETKNLIAAAAAIRHELNTKYGEPNASQRSGRPARQTVKIVED